MKFLFYGDLQIDRANSMYSEFLQSTLKHLTKVIQERQPDYLINLGDVLDGFGHVTVQDLTYSYDWMEYLGQLVRPSLEQYECLAGAVGESRHWILKGNHDIGDKEGKHSTVHVMSCDMTNTIFKRIETPEIPNVGYVLVIPYTSNYAAVRAELDKMAGMPVKAIFAHTDWFGLRPSIKSAYVETDGLDPARLAELFPGVPIFGGHYHTPVSMENLHIVGSPLHKDFNDVLTDIPRGFLEWDSESGEIERIANPCTYYCAEVRAESHADLASQARALLPNKDQLRVKVYVPLSLVREADAEFEPFLWHAIYPMTSSKKSVEHTADVRLHASASELVELGVKQASGDYDSELLRRCGMEAFR